ncbi:MAG: ATP-dependent DNA helicase [Armatimonadetes bacterium]|nr:ATP-dependent DNA helicase [Armatimonadota bacterium]
MSDYRELIESAFDRLREQPGFVDRPDQYQLALLLGDLMVGGGSGAIEAPTGLGKSLASLIPAIAVAVSHQKRIAIGTFTNVLADQYWRKDLPFALSLFDLPEGTIKTQQLMGRQRYACQMSLEEFPRDISDAFRREAEMGTENEFRRIVKKPMREISQIWPKVAAPQICAGKFCPAYNDCYYFKARQRAESAHLILTNHSILLQDALAARVSQDDVGFLGKLDFILFDEAHDLYSAALGALEFQVDTNSLSGLQSIAARLGRELLPEARSHQSEDDWNAILQDFQHDIEICKQDLNLLSIEKGKQGIFAISPVEVEKHPGMDKYMGNSEGIDPLMYAVSRACDKFLDQVTEIKRGWQAGPASNELVRMYSMAIGDYGDRCRLFMTPAGLSVSYSKTGPVNGYRQDTVGVAEPLKELLWDRIPYACLSATLALDSSFDFYNDLVGCKPGTEEILPSPFDFTTQASLYLPKPGKIPDPTVARKQGSEHLYFQAIADELTEIIQAMSGRTLALFHSRREMEAVYALMPRDEELPITIQPRMAPGPIGDMFKRRTNSSLFGLRSFWTGFDAPGDTLSCVVIVRVPFEVPTEPPVIVRMASLVQAGKDPFREHTLAQAKLLIRQGAGRLIRTETDRGVIALLDPRVQSKPYGEEILMNLPMDMSRFTDIYEAMAAVGLE